MPVRLVGGRASRRGACLKDSEASDRPCDPAGPGESPPGCVAISEPQPVSLRWGAWSAAWAEHLAQKKEKPMNWDQIEGNWMQLKGKARENWGKITDDEFTQAEGKRDQLVGLVQKKYGEAKDAAERQVDAWMKRIS